MQVEFLTRQMIMTLTYLLDHPGAKKADFLNNLKLDPHGFQGAFKVLYEGKYIVEVPDPRWKLWKLTSRGEHVARLLKEVIEEGGEHT